MLHLHRAERADRLVDALGAVLAVPPADPMAPELVAVHSRGIERWLAQELSGRLGGGPSGGDGVCANVEFPFPSRVVGRALAAAGGIDPDSDPWPPERLVWPLLEVVDARLDEAWLAPLAAHVRGSDGREDGEPSARRYSAARHIADLFDRYAIHRPGMVRAWAQDDGSGAADVDGAGQPLPADTVWQPRLWRLVRARVGVPSPAERLSNAVTRLAEGVEVPGLPGRLSLFGLTALPSSYVAVLSALARSRQVHLFLLHPSPALWRRVAERLAGASRPGTGRREEDPTRDLPRHPVLASWGRDAREMQVVVSAVASGTGGGTTGGDGPAAEPDTLLGRIQADVRADRRPPGAPLADEDDPRPLLAADDRSLQVHACHGRTRQVQVLRDAILHLLADDVTLEARDVVVMCPDVEAFAPIVHAVFGAHAVDGDGATGTGQGGATGTGDGAGLPDLRVRLADRAIRQTNPVLRVVADLLDLADGRVTASEVLDLAARAPVRRRFRLDDDDLERLEAWVADARIRWGLDADHRAAFGLAGVAANSWRAGLDRLLVGTCMADEDDRVIGGTVPLDDVEGADVDLAGRLAELVDRLGAALTDLSGRKPLAGWRDALVAAAQALTATSERDRWQALQLHRLLDEAVAEAGVVDGASGVELNLPETRALLSDRLRGRPSRANHRTGDLTVSTLVPMRSVPHRVICLLGMDDGAFPRRTAGDGDDLVERDPHVGDRDPRTEDRQLLLDALLAAGEHLVVTYTGRDECTNEPRPPAVPIGELLDAVDRTARAADGRPARHQVVVEHPLQAFDPRNFRPSGLGGRTWGFDRAALAGARVRARGPGPAVPFLSAALPAPDDRDVITLADLVGFVEHPVKAFLRARLGVSLPRDAEEPGDAIPVELDALARYEVGERLLASRLAGGGFQRWVAAERARGVLPPGALARPVLAETAETVEAIAAAARAHTGAGCDGVLDVDVPLPCGRRLLGSVPVAGDVVLGVRYARVAARHRLAAWVRLLAATTAHPERALRAVTVGRYRKSGSKTKLVTVVCAGPLGDSAATRRRRAADELARIVDLYDRGMREPLPLYCQTSAAYAEATVRGGDAEAAARKRWESDWGFAKEDRDPEHLLVLGGPAPLESLLEEPPCAGEDGSGWADGDEPGRFGRYARRLWGPLLAVEEVEDR